MIKRKMDIESALRWVFRDELCKRGNVASTAAGGQWQRITKVGLYGTAIDEGWPEPGHPAALGDPHPDALRVEQAVRGLDAISSAELDDESIMIGLEGFGLDASTYVRRAMQNVPALVSIAARLGNRPSWGCQPEIKPLKGANGQCVIRRTEPHFVPVEYQVVKDRRGREATKPIRFAELPNDVPAPPIRAGHYPQGAFCVLVWSPKPELILLDRAEYAVWWAALDYLADEISGALDTIEIQPPSAPQRPWLGETERTTRVHIRIEPKARAMA